MSPVHLHLVLNHVPVLGVVFAICLLAAGMVRRSDPLVRAAMVTMLVAAAFALPTFFTGEPAEHAVEKMAGVLDSRIEQHEAAAKVALVVVTALGILALACLVAWRRRTEAPRLGATALLVVALAAGGTLLHAANLGGQIRHTEIASAAPMLSPAEQGDRQGGAEPGFPTRRGHDRREDGERH